MATSKRVWFVVLVLALAVLAAGYMVVGSGDTDRPGRPSPHALDQDQ